MIWGYPYFWKHPHVKTFKKRHSSARSYVWGSFVPCNSQTTTPQQQNTPPRRQLSSQDDDNDTVMIFPSTKNTSVFYQTLQLKFKWFKKITMSLVWKKKRASNNHKTYFHVCMQLFSVPGTKLNLEKASNKRPGTARASWFSVSMNWCFRHPLNYSKVKKKSMDSFSSNLGKGHPLDTKEETWTTCWREGVVLWFCWRRPAQHLPKWKFFMKENSFIDKKRLVEH